MKQERTEKTTIQICESFIKGKCYHQKGTTHTATTKGKNLKTYKYIKGLSLVSVGGLKEWKHKKEYRNLKRN